MLSYTLLGQPRLVLDGSQVTSFRSKKEAALLFYLAHTTEAHRRDQIARLFWPDRTPKQGLSNLRTVIARLRKLVGDHLLVSRTTLELNPDKLFQVDSVRLVNELINGESVDSAEKATILKQTLDNYKEEFLLDFSLSDAPEFDNWMMTTRTQIYVLVVAGYEQLGRYTVASGETRWGRKIVDRLLDLDDSNETAHLLLKQLNDTTSGNTKTPAATNGEGDELQATEDFVPSSQLKDRPTQFTKSVRSIFRPKNHPKTCQRITHRTVVPTCYAGWVRRGRQNKVVAQYCA